jgi:ComF family protein
MHRREHGAALSRRPTARTVPAVPRWRDRLLDAVFPLACVACLQLVRGSAAALGPLCEACRTMAVAPPAPVCVRCGVPLRGDTTRTGAPTCHPCGAHPPAFTVARGAALYDPTGAAAGLVSALHAFKYRGARTLARPLATLMTTRLPIPPAVVLVPVPLHPSRLRERRYNQAALLVRAIAERVPRPIALRAVARRLATPPQAGLDATERRANLTGAFVVRHPQAIAGRHVLLIDDVITTGATADACARALLAAGALRVDVYAVGRTPLEPRP